MSAVSLAIVNREDQPIYCVEFPSKYHWKAEGIAADDELFGLNLSKKERDVDTTEEKTNDIGGFNCSLKQQFILHTALDRFAQLAGPPPGYMWRNPNATGMDAFFVGLLCPVEDYRVYGYITSTKIKIIFVVEDDEMSPLSDQPTVDDNIKCLMGTIHKHFIEYTLNPFSKLDGPINSKRFDQKVQEDVESFNRSIS